MSPSSVYRCCKEGVNIDKKERSRKSTDTQGRPNILSARDVSYFLRTFKTIRKDGKHPTVTEIMNVAEISKGSYKIYIRILHDAGYRKFQQRKKGLLSMKVKKRGESFAVRALKKHTDTFKTHDMAPYLDAVSFVYKHNPF